MNYKHFLSSWFGLGLLTFMLQYPFFYLLKLIGMADLSSISIILAGFTASMLFTRQVYPHLMSRSFKIYAIFTYFGISLPVTVIALLSNGALRSVLFAQLQNLFATSPLSHILLFFAGTLASLLFALAIQAVALYFMIGMSNQQVIQDINKKHRATK